MDDELLILGRALRLLRHQHGLSQEALGAETMTHRNYVGALERGESNPTFRVLLRLTRGMDVPVSALIARYEWLRAAQRETTPGGRIRFRT